MEPVTHKPVASPWRDRLLKYTLAAVVFVVIAVGSELAGAQNGPRVAIRVALALTIVIAGWQYFRQLGNRRD